MTLQHALGGPANAFCLLESNVSNSKISKLSVKCNSHHIYSCMASP